MSRNDGAEMGAAVVTDAMAHTALRPGVAGLLGVSARLPAIARLGRQPSVYAGEERSHLLAGDRIVRRIGGFAGAGGYAEPVDTVA